MSIKFRPSQFPLTKAELNETEVIEIHLQDEDVLSILPDADCFRIPNRQKKTNSLDVDILANRVHVVESCLIRNDKENQRRDRVLEELVKSLTVMREQGKVQMVKQPKFSYVTHFFKCPCNRICFFPWCIGTND